MSRPEALTSLLEELEADECEHPVAQHPGAGAIVYAGNDEEMTFDAAECNSVFQSVRNVRAFFESLGSPEDAAIEFRDCTVSPEVLTEVERLFSAVDES